MLFWFALAAHAQEIVVQPFLQTATPTSVWIVWETDEWDDSAVEWGPTPVPGHTTSGQAHPGHSGSRIHEVQLTELLPSTRYWYRARTLTTRSAIRSFTTPPSQGSELPFSLVAMSDMQRSLDDPDKWREVVVDGVLATITPDDVTQIDQELAFVLIPGDLVENGLDYDSWATEFFEPAEDLFGSVPVYPVLGNHEQNSLYYFSYFHLPYNGTLDFEEHWWWFDHGNVRVIGLDSNFQYWTTTQQDWLYDTLTDACEDEDIDFVFAQLHHPFHSELWTPGEAPFTSTVIELLEEFTRDCGKPSIHFFGHSHGYSRGASSEHRHLMVDVASAGGAIDRWGEQEQKDYPEYAVSTDDWGFVKVDVVAGAAPSFTLTRTSRGNRDGIVDNAVTDTVVVRRYDEPPATPVPTSPKGTALADCFTMRGGPYVDPDGDAQGAAAWQIAECDGFDTPLWESWHQDKDLYFGRDRQAGDDLTDELAIRPVPIGAYCWRVRYRDSGLAWSEWSEPVPFVVGEPVRTDDLLGAGFEGGLSGFDPQTSGIEAVTYRECDVEPPPEGIRALSLGACAGNPSGRADRAVSVGSHSEAIDAGESWAWLSGWFFEQEGDVTTATLLFRDEAGDRIDESAPLSAAPGGWFHVEQSSPVPVGTRSIEIRLERTGSTTTTSFVDGVSLALGPEEDIDCAALTDGTDPEPERRCGCGGGVVAWWPALLALLATRRIRAYAGPLSGRPS